MRSSRKSAAIAVLLFAAAAPSAAEEARRSSDATARLQVMLQQLNAEKTKLAADNQKLVAERDSLKKELEAVESKASGEKQRLSRAAQDLATAQAGRASVQQAFDTLKGRFEALVEQYKKTVGVLREVEAERNTLSEMAADYQKRVTVCETNNETLYRNTLELIDRYDEKGILDTLRQREPVTGLGRVRLENLMEEYRNIADDMRIKYETATAPDGDEANGSAGAAGR
jgi:chromosome segregation ATPase